MWQDAKAFHNQNFPEIHASLEGGGATEAELCAAEEELGM
mgnify:FL=1